MRTLNKNRTYFGSVPESATRLYTAMMFDENNTPRPALGTQSLVVTIYNKHDGEIINNREAQNVLNANGGTLDASGNFAFTFNAEDTALQDQTLPYENRIALFEWTYPAGASGDDIKYGRHEIEMQVRNLTKVLDEELVP